MDRFTYEGVDIGAVIDRLPREAVDRLPFGTVKVDERGTILEYNMAEASISGVDARSVIGKNFFLEVAVCTQRPEFYGEFKRAMDDGTLLNTIFDFTFENSVYAEVSQPFRVRVRMFSTRDAAGVRVVWILVRRVLGIASAASAGRVAGERRTGPNPGDAPHRSRDEERGEDGDIAVHFD